MIDAPTPYLFLYRNTPYYTPYPNTPSYTSYRRTGTTIMIDARPGDPMLTFQSIIDIKAAGSGAPTDTDSTIASAEENIMQ